MKSTLAEPHGVPETAAEADRLLVLALLALLLGALTGLVAAIFRLALQEADRFRETVLAWAHGAELGGVLLLLVAAAAATGLAAWLVRRFAPPAAGSGIPHVEAVLRGEQPQAPFLLLP